MVPQVVPVNLEATLIVHMHEFMHHRVLHVLRAEEVPCAKHDSTSVVLETSGACLVTGSAQNILCWHFAANQLQVLEHEHDHRTYETTAVSSQFVHGRTERTVIHKIVLVLLTPSDLVCP